MTDVPDFLRAGEIARLAGVSVRTVRRWIAEETLPSVKLRGVRLVWRKDLELMPCPGPQTWSDPEEEMQVEQEVIHDRENTDQELVPSVV